MPKLLTGKDYKNVPVTYKEDSPGEFTAVFSTLNAIDHDGDVTIPGAFHDQGVKISAWGHAWGDLPVGRGDIHENDETMEAAVKGRFFLDTTHGLDTYRTVKGLDNLQEWSYGFTIVDAEMGQFQGQTVRFLKNLDVFEVSPVMRGAGQNTRTTTIKGDSMTLTDHSEQTLADVSAWVSRLQSVAKLRTGQGKSPLADINLDRLQGLKSFLDDAQGTLAELIDVLKGGNTPDLDVERLFLDFQRNLTRSNEVIYANNS